jgi:hypothetical protein
LESSRWSIVWRERWRRCLCPRQKEAKESHVTSEVWIWIWSNPRLFQHTSCVLDSFRTEHNKKSNTTLTWRLLWDSREADSWHGIMGSFPDAHGTREKGTRGKNSKEHCWWNNQAIKSKGTAGGWPRRVREPSLSNVEALSEPCVLVSTK